MFCKILLFFAFKELKINLKFICFLPYDKKEFYKNISRELRNLLSIAQYMQKCSRSLKYLIFNIIYLYSCN